MTTITKERIELFIKNPLENGLTRGEQMELARIALASLEADPVKRVNSDQMRRVCLEANRHLDKYDAMAKEVNKLLGRIAPPAPVVPEEATPENVEMLSGYVSTYKLTDSERDIAAEIWNACRTAMLHGAEPVSQTYKSQHTQFEQVADLYEMQFDDGRTCAFHTDAQKAAQWLQACDGNRVQEYVKLERLRNALSGNYPVTPDGWISCSERMPDKLIPVIVMYEDGEMWSAMWNGNRWDDGTEYPDPHSVTHWREMPAAPQQEVK
ncbi:TPA: DUF551 domain-containing protein [Escherichia coli]|nr:DUF551 domain-containing protein [Escherichia coli]